jgi:hypothetical protein
MRGIGLCVIGACLAVSCSEATEPINDAKNTTDVIDLNGIRREAQTWQFTEAESPKSGRPIIIGSLTETYDVATAGPLFQPASMAIWRMPEDQQFVKVWFLDRSRHLAACPYVQCFILVSFDGGAMTPYATFDNVYPENGLLIAASWDFATKALAAETVEFYFHTSDQDQRRYVFKTSGYWSKAQTTDINIPPLLADQTRPG